MRGFLCFILGLVIGGWAIHVYDQREFGPGGYVGDSGPNQDDLSQKIRDWHLTPEDIRADLDRSGEVVRTNAQVVGQKLDDARIVATIKAKYLIDRELSAIDIHVESHDGNVLLTGTVASPRLIGRAVLLALDTGGVRNVTARLQSKS